MDKVCADCAAGLDHCHGTPIEHPGGEIDCTERGCTDTHLLRHDLRIDCHEIVGGCGCEYVEVLAFAA